MFLSSLSWVVWLSTQGISPPALESVSPRSSPPTSRDTPKAAGSALGGACGVGCSGPSGRARAIGGSPHPRRGLARPSSAQPAASLSGSETDAGSGTGTSFGTGKWEQGQVLPRQKDGTAASCRGGPGYGTLDGVGWERDRRLGHPTPFTAHLQKLMAWAGGTEGLYSQRPGSPCFCSKEGLTQAGEQVADSCSLRGQDCLRGCRAAQMPPSCVRMFPPG